MLLPAVGIVIKAHYLILGHWNALSRYYCFSIMPMVNLLNGLLSYITTLAA